MARNTNHQEEATDYERILDVRLENFSIQRSLLSHEVAMLACFPSGLQIINKN
jgi:hypothetical protein